MSTTTRATTTTSIVYVDVDTLIGVNDNKNVQVQTVPPPHLPPLIISIPLVPRPLPQIVIASFNLLASR